MKTGLPAWPETDRDRARLTRFTFLTHLRPVSLHPRALRWSQTFGLGGSSLVLLLLLVATGALQMMVYQPVPGAAYDSIGALENDMAFGFLVRGIHYWSANLLVLVAFLHALRVLFTGGYGGQRRFTWVLGAVLLMIVLLSCFTGYLLPWDQLSYWATTISTGMLTYVPGIGVRLQEIVLGGPEISELTLGRFYTVHTTGAPVALLPLAAWHFWRVRRAGGVVYPKDDPPREGEPEKVMFWPHLIVREVAQGLAVVALVMVLAAMFGAPLGEAANPGMSPNPAKAPWYFMGFQELLIHFHPVLAVLILPLLAVVGFLALPYLAPAEVPEGHWFLSDAGRRSAGVAALLALVLTPIIVVWDEHAGLIGDGLVTGAVIPLAKLIVVCVLLAYWARRKAGPAEGVQAVLVYLLMSFVVMTVIGVWFRGPGMALVWPWMGGA